VDEEVGLAAKADLAAQWVKGRDREVKKKEKTGRDTVTTYSAGSETSL